MCACRWRLISMSPRAIDFCILMFLSRMSIPKCAPEVSCHIRRYSISNVWKAEPSQQFLFQLIQEFKTAPISRWRNDRYLIIILVDSGRGTTLRTQLCSMQYANIDRDSILYICLDQPSRDIVTQHGYKSLLFDPDQLTYVQRYRIKIVLAYLAIEHNIECFIIDSDIIFFDDFDKIWHLSRTGFNVEISSDEPEVVESGRLHNMFLVNSGLIRFIPGKQTEDFLITVLKFAETNNEFDQDLYGAILRKARKTDVDGLRIWSCKTVNLQYITIDPFKVPNGGLAFCRGRQKLCDFAKRYDISSPVAVHFNFHNPAETKRMTMENLGISVESPGSVCIRPVWKYWPDCNFPSSIYCKDWKITYNLTERG